MATGTYKSTVPIIVAYQAVNCATGKTVTMDVYDEEHNKDADKCVAAMTELVYDATGTGRYWATFTPDNEGEWVCVMKNTTDNNGDVVKAFAVAGHDVDEIGDAVEAIDTLTKALGDGDLAAMKVILDAESGVKADVGTVDTVVDAIKAVTDVESGVKAAVDAQHNFNPAVDAVATVTALTGHTAQTGDTYALADGASGFVAIKAVVDGIGSPAMVG